MRVTTQPPEPVPPTFVLELTEKEFLHLAVTLYTKEPYDQGNSLYGDLPDDVRGRVSRMSVNEKESRLNAGWRKRN